MNEAESIIKAQSILRKLSNERGMIDSDVGFELMFGPAIPDKLYIRKNQHLETKVYDISFTKKFR